MTYTYSELAALMGSITATSNDAIVEQAYAIVAGREADAAGKAYWVGRLEDDLTPETLIAAMIRGAEAYKENNPGEASYDIDTIAIKEQAAKELTDLGVSADDVAAALISVKDIASANAAIAAVTGDTDTDTDGGTSFTGIVAQASGVTEGTAGADTIYMSTGQDFVFAGEGDDMIVARGNSSFDNADIIDGGAGTDTIEVMLDNQETAESPLVMNVEILKVQAQDTAVTSASGDNDIVESNIDAGDMRSVQQYWSEDSRANLVIEDVSRDSHITTIGMRETDPDVDYTVHFDPENITKPGATEAGATLLIKMANVLQVAEGGNPIENFTQFSFSIDTTEVVVDVSAATDYDDVVEAIEAAAAAKGLDVTVEKQAATNAFFSIDIAGYTAGDIAGTYNPILITNNGAGSLVKGSFETAEDATDAAYTNTMSTGAAATTPALTQVDVVLDRVGKDSQGGVLTIGSDSNGDSGSKGIQQFNIDVDRNSWLELIQSTNDTLEVVNVENIEVNSDGNGSLKVDLIENIRVFDASTMTGAADVTVTLDEKTTTKYLNLTDDATNSAADNSEGSFLNVIDREFSYDFGSGNDKLDLTIDGSNLAEAGTTTREDFVLEVRTGNGNDTITTDIGNMTANAYANSKENANLEINAGEGNDTITTTGDGDWIITAGNGDDTVYSDNSGAKANWVVNATGNAGSAAVAENAEFNAIAPVADNGTVTVTANGVLLGTYTASVGNGGTAAQVAANVAGLSTLLTVDPLDNTKVLYVSAVAGAEVDLVIGGTSAASIGPVTVTQQGADLVPDTIDATDLDSAGAGASALLYGAKLTVTYSGALGVNTEAAAATNEGFESTVTIGTSNYVGNQTNVNQAIKDAINNDDVLNKLLVAKDGPANTLVITSLVDGVHVSEDISITVTAATLANLSASEQAGLDTAWETLNNNSTLDVAKGDLDAAASAAQAASLAKIDTAGTAANNRGSDNTIDLGAGDDVLVLSTDADSAETIVFTGSNIGNNTIVNFTLADDILDFTSYLTDRQGNNGSTSEESQTVIATTLTTNNGGTNLDLTSSEIVIVSNFVADNGADATAGTADDETWANLTASKLDDALTDAAADGSLDYGSINAGATTANAALIGGTQTSILMIENDANDGEYKVFEVTETVATSAYTVTMLGTVDFGDSIDGTAVIA